MTLKLEGLPGTSVPSCTTDWARFADISKKNPVAVGTLNRGQIEEEAEYITNYVQSVLQECKVPVSVLPKVLLGTNN